MSGIDYQQIALDYHKRGWNVIPVEGKKSVLSGWKRWQSDKQDIGWINRLEPYWNTATGIAVVCGKVSDNLMIIDLDGQEAVDLFYETFPELTRTYTVKTGSGVGRHLYFYQHKHFITNMKVKVGSGGIELHATNRYCVAPPSLHESGNRYEVLDGWKIKRIATLGRVARWLKRYRLSQMSDTSAPQQTIKKEEIEKSPRPTDNKPTSTQTSESERHQLWAQTALTQEFGLVSTATSGARNDRLYHSALKLGSIIAGGYLSRIDVENSLMRAADVSGLVKDDGKAQCESTIKSGITAGMQSPRHPADKSDNQDTAKHGVALDRTPEDDNHPLPKNPDAEELAQYIQAQMQMQYTYFRDSWQFYEGGIWKPIKNLNRGITKVIKSVRHRGVKANPAIVNNVDFFLKTYMELMDESVIDDYPNYISARNGMFNLDTMKLEDHSPSLYITGKTNWDYNPEATCPTFLKWLSSMLTFPDGTPDPLMLDLVQEAFGYSLTTDTRYRMSFWLKGPKHSGKSTLLEVLSEMLSIYHGVLDLNQLDKNRFMLALTYGKRVVTCPEVEKGLKINDGQYKTLVDNASKVVADVKNQEPITFKPTAKIWWAMNNYPHISDNTGAVHSRVTVIPYHRTITIEERDLDLLDKIRCELSGVFNWALEGLIRLNHYKRFTVVPQSDELKDELEVKDSIYRQFITDEEWCKPGTEILSKDLNKAFVAWCDYHRIKGYAKTPQGRAPNFLDAGLTNDKVGGQSKFYGVELTTYAQRQIGRV